MNESKEKETIELLKGIKKYLGWILFLLLLPIIAGIFWGIFFLSLFTNKPVLIAVSVVVVLAIIYYLTERRK